MHLADEAEQRLLLSGIGEDDLPEDIDEDDDAYIHEENNWPSQSSEDDLSED